MTDKKLMEEIDKERNKKEPFAFWGMLFALLSLGYGEFIIRVSGFLLAHSEPYMQKLPENLIGAVLLVGGILKLIGVFTGVKWCKRWGIWILGGIWSGLFVVSAAYSFGSGFPHPSWMFALLAMVACWRIALKGDFY